jgi:drug/metabolite transporter (DMT)-like permease
MGPVEWALLLLLSVLWGGSFFFVKVALAEIAPFTLVTARVGLAALALLVYIRARAIALPRAAGTWGALLFMGLLNNALPFSLIAFGQTRIDSGFAAILNATTPLFTVLLAHLLTRDERLTPARAAGVLVGFAGAVVLIGPSALDRFGADALAQLAVLAAACSYACAGIFGRRFRGLPPAVSAFGMLAGAFLLVLPIDLLVERPWMATPGAVAAAATAGLALLSTAAAYLIYFRILATAGATNLLLVTFLIPVSALLLGALVLGERLAGSAVLGMGLIFLGLAVIDGRLPTRLLPGRWLR